MLGVLDDSLERLVCVSRMVSMDCPLLGGATLNRTVDFQYFSIAAAIFRTYLFIFAWVHQKLV